MLAGFWRHRPHLGVSRDWRADLAVLRSKDELLDSIDAHIAQDRSELEQARSTGDKSKAAHLEAELKDRGLPFNSLGIMTAIYLIGARSAGRAGARILCKSPDNLAIAERHGPTD